MSPGDLAELRRVLAWVDQVYPGKTRDGGAIVHLTWEEFNAMRAVLGLPMRNPPPRATSTVRVVSYRAPGDGR